ncbi:protein lifeguard 1-like [Clupea harengus]|uniref:Protein lifeguard 1-like n=1 Tax=Clupea harengus TaxID=7950 RepID=A0A6P3VK64_CLUHA|nr:protein lifeguard 1-like [Clupea harengus]
MDPSKASAPPPGWNHDDKAGMTYPPPPYQDHPQYPNPGAYPPPGAMPPQGAYYPPGPGGPPQAAPMGQPYPQGQYHQGQPYPQGQYPQGQYPHGATVMVQPTVFVTHSPLVNPVSDYLGYSIFTMLCCCLPLGIAALIFSISTREANSQGNRQMAEKNSQTARKLNHAALGIGLTIIILYIVVSIVFTSQV